MNSSKILQRYKDGRLYFDENLLACIQSLDYTGVKSILQHVNPCDIIDSDGSTLLHYATEYGNTEIVEYFIDKGINVDAINNFGNTALTIAANAYTQCIIDLLLQTKASVLIANNAGDCAAKLIVGNSRVRNVDILNNFMKRVKEEYSNDSKLTAMKLLEFKCPLNRVVMLKDAMVTEYMLDNGCDVNGREKCDGRWTALHQAVSLSDLENVKLLVKRGARVDIKDCMTGKTPLFLYDMESDETDEKIEILKLLLDNGASVDIRSRAGTSVAELFFIRAQRRAIQMLLRYNINLRTRSEDGNTLIHCISLNSYAGVIEELSKIKDFDANVQNDLGNTALVYAVRNGHIDTVKFLLKNGAQVNLISNDGATALFQAVTERSKKQKDKLKCVKLLLQYGADVQYVIHDDIAVIDCALVTNNFVVITPVLASLALIEVRGEKVKDIILERINANNRPRNYFNFCKQKIELMKRTVIYGSVTLFKILTESDLKIRKYMRHEKLAKKLASLIYTKRNSKLYIYNVLRRRIVTAVEHAKLRKEAIELLLTFVELNNNWIVADKIVDFLSLHDLKILNDVL